MRTFAISPGVGELMPWLNVLPTWVTDVVLREPDTPPREVLHAGQSVISSTRMLWIHERCPQADLTARSLQCGLHLTSEGLPTSLPHGRSCHDTKELNASFAEGAVYAFLSPVFPPNSKPDDRATIGIERFLEMAGDRAVVALGGITQARRTQLEAASAWGVAMLGALS